MLQELNNNTICAQATSVGQGAISLIRVSGPDALQLVSKAFVSRKGRKLEEMHGYTMCLGSFTNEAGTVLDDVVAAVYRAPESYTGEDMVEISCHASPYIVSEIIRVLVDLGCRYAEPGEFTRRAFLNGKMDLAQAEAVADVIASETEASHKIAMQQLKGGFSNELARMRTQLLKIVSLMELELDFSEEDVEFANRDELRELLDKVTAHISELISSFKLGNAIKNGVPVAIVGATNTGKSTLLNTLLGEDRAIVSSIAGTTRDTIEDTVNIDGILFRFIDTAGIRRTLETIEIAGIERTYYKIKQASVVLLVLDYTRQDDFEESVKNLSTNLSSKDKTLIILVNKIDEKPVVVTNIFEAEAAGTVTPEDNVNKVCDTSIFPTDTKSRTVFTPFSNCSSRTRPSARTIRPATSASNCWKMTRTSSSISVRNPTPMPFSKHATMPPSASWKRRLKTAKPLSWTPNTVSSMVL